MDHFTIIRLYHQALQRWWVQTEDKDEYSISFTSIDIESVFIHIFKFYPPRILLLSSNGKCTTVSSMEETAPSFRTCRYMKIDNKTSISSIKNVIPVFYQLLSIDTSEPLCIMDVIAIIKWIQLLLSENSAIDFSSCECFHYIKRQFFHGPDFLSDPEKEKWKKEIRDSILNLFYEKDMESMFLKKNESYLLQLQECYQMLEKINKTLDLHEERMDLYFEWIKNQKNENENEKNQITY